MTDEEILQILDGAFPHDEKSAEAASYRALLSHIATTKDAIIPSEALATKLIDAFHAETRGAGQADTKGAVQSPYIGKSLWYDRIMASPWKIVAPIALILLVFGVMTKFDGTDNRHQGAPLAVDTQVMRVESVLPPEGSVTSPSPAPTAQPATLPMMMSAAKMMPKSTSTAHEVVALLALEADADVATSSSNYDVNFLSIDPDSVNYLNQNYDAATN